ncbi:hypothetical protein PU560_03590 [Georgenia sp. 10Sc9-8]|uniref:GATA-type domain-containing protein n=1 Tax=Georgenia halotolerans TaxID=3028317 RepID=A0ABT5TU24_9MICO|nr:hypothetical protein [Georgenia halotolerans]
MSSDQVSSGPGRSRRLGAPRRCPGARQHPQAEPLRRTVNGRIQALTDCPTEQRTGSDCLDCGGRLIQQWTDRHGLDDDIVCSSCGRQYTYAFHTLAVRSKIQAAPQ